MEYNEISKKAIMKYIKDKQQRLYVNYKKDEYEQNIKTIQMYQIVIYLFY